jgi:hypothetical protein
MEFKERRRKIAQGSELDVSKAIMPFLSKLRILNPML